MTLLGAHAFGGTKRIEEIFKIMEIEILKVSVKRVTFPMLTVYENNRAQLNKNASDDFGLSGFQYYNAGKSNNVLYLIPSENKSEYSQRGKCGKNGLVSFNDIIWNKSVGLEPKSRYKVDRIEDEDGIFLKLTKI